jgi:GNAT superfamily N-acetyltransferase
MARFVHDPSRVHPPPNEGGLPSVASEQRSAIIPPYPTEPVVDTTRSVAAPRQTGEIGQLEDSASPRTVQQLYEDPGISMISMVLGASGEPHRVMYVTTQRFWRGQGRARTLLEQICADLDKDGMSCGVRMPNVEPDCDLPRFVAFFEKHGFVSQTPPPGATFPVMFRYPRMRKTNEQQKILEAWRASSYA